MAKRAKRPVFVPYVQRTGTPVMLPLFGPASTTREAAQERLDRAMGTGNYAKGEVRSA